MKITKRFCLYILFVLAGVFMIFASDESAKPLNLTSDDLKRQAGGAEYDYIRIGEDSGYQGILANSSNFMLETGNYSLGVEYRTDKEGNTVSVFNNGEESLYFELDPDFTYAEFPFMLDKDSQEIVFKINYAGVGNLAVTSLRLSAENRFYNDAFFYVGLFLALNVIGWCLVKSRRWKSLEQEGRIAFVMLIGIGLFAFLPYMNGALRWGDDLCYHLIRIEGIKDGLASGQLPVIIYPEGLYGNGYLNCMYPNLFLYIPALLRLMGISMAGSYKFLICLFHLGTAFASYYAVKTITNSRRGALLAAVLYTLCPYRMTNIYARGAVGEILAMTFMPLLLAGLYHVLIGERKKWWILALGISGLIQSHVLSAVIGLVCCVIFGVIFLESVIREKRWMEILKAAGVTLLLNLWFAVPFVFFYLKGNLGTTALDWAAFSEYSLQFSGLFAMINTGDYRTLTLGLPIAACAAIALLYLLFYADKTPRDRFIRTAFVLGCIAVFMVVNQFPAWPLMNLKPFDFLFRNIQFAWRMLGPASALLILCGTCCMDKTPVLKEYNKVLPVFLAGVTLLTAVRFQAQDFAYKNYTDTYTQGHLSKIVGIPKGENTIVYPYEWRPAGTVDGVLSTEPLLSDADSTIVMEHTRVGTKTTVYYNCSKDGQTITLPVINYAGYRAYDDNMQELKIVQSSYNNCIEIALIGDGLPHQIIVEYKGKAVFTASFAVSLAGAAACGFIIIRKKRKQKNG